jgi:hypothetical protein
VQKTSAALKTPYEELEEFLKEQGHVYIDETSFKKNGKLQTIQPALLDAERSVKQKREVKRPAKTESGQKTFDFDG